MRGQDRQAISGPLTPVTRGLSRSLTDSRSRRSGRVAARTAQIPKLIVRVRFSSPAPPRRRRLASRCWPPAPGREGGDRPTAPRCRRAHARRGRRRDFRRGSATRPRRRRSCPGHAPDLDDQDGLVAVSAQRGLDGLVGRRCARGPSAGTPPPPGHHQQPPWGLGCFHAPGAVPVELPRVFRTGNLLLIHAAACISRYSSMTSCGVRYPSTGGRRWTALDGPDAPDQMLPEVSACPLRARSGSNRGTHGHSRRGQHGTRAGTGQLARRRPTTFQAGGRAVQRKDAPGAH